MTTEEIAAKEAELIKTEAGHDARMKNEYKAILKAEHTDEQGTVHKCYFKKPSRMTIGLAMAEIEKNVVQACEYVFIDSVIREVSDVDYFMNNDEVFMGLIPKLQSLVLVKKSTFTTL